jgi:hypothetical protein
MRGATTLPPVQRKQLLAQKVPRERAPPIFPRSAPSDKPTSRLGPHAALDAAGALLASDAAAPSGAGKLTYSTAALGPGSSKDHLPTQMPASRIPAPFHVHDAAGRLIFPAQSPQGDAQVALLSQALGAMVEEWQKRLDENRPTFPMSAARWGVLQMCIYDMWCTIEESRIWDLGLSELERLAHAHSPALCKLLGEVRGQSSSAFSTLHSMSQRLQYELQRWHVQWVEQSDALRHANSERHVLQQRVEQLQTRVQGLEEELELRSAARAANAGDTHPIEDRCRKLQTENAKVSVQVRSLQAANAKLRSSELSLRLANEGLLDELSRWRASLGKSGAAISDGNRPSHSGSVAPEPAPTAEAVASLTSLFNSFPPEAQGLAVSRPAAGTALRHGRSARPYAHAPHAHAPRAQPCAPRTSLPLPAVTQLERMVSMHAELGRKGGQPDGHQAGAPQLPASTAARRGALPAADILRAAALQSLASVLSAEEADTLATALAHRRASPVHAELLPGPAAAMAPRAGLG